MDVRAKFVVLGRWQKAALSRKHASPMTYSRLCIMFPGRKSGFRAGFRPDSNRESLEIGPPAGEGQPERRFVYVLPSALPSAPEARQFQKVGARVEVDVKCRFQPRTHASAKPWVGGRAPKQGGDGSNQHIYGAGAVAPDLFFPGHLHSLTYAFMYLRLLPRRPLKHAHFKWSAHE